MDLSQSSKEFKKVLGHHNTYEMNSSVSFVNETSVAKSESEVDLGAQSHADKCKSKRQLVYMVSNQSPEDLDTGSGGAKNSVSDN